ncbi:hypothetical protein T484DRAFT_1926054 [Baffinella frigidus]|nr:hypothetical protein T484DRAFT_1926054 [Cryptophyta sp. CCMP2293]
MSDMTTGQQWQVRGAPIPFLQPGTTRDVDGTLLPSIANSVGERAIALIKSQLPALRASAKARFQGEMQRVNAVRMRLGDQNLREQKLRQVIATLKSQDAGLEHDLAEQHKRLSVAGPDGARGHDGNRGEPGPPGANVMGTEGMPGRQGSVGEAGPVGPMGDTGVDGPEGAQGVVGPLGDRGRQGKVGRRGVEGDQGANGPNGHKGPGGAVGLRGFNGLIGTRGLQGPWGMDGPQGPQGRAGPEGVQGSHGLAGWPGPTGPAGMQGLPGIQGTTGVVGSQGPMGIPGIAGPLGPAGPSGQAGGSGVSGLQGERGGRGQEGEVGPPGLTVRGRTGRTADNGAQGTAGTDGAAGANGANGIEGRAGAPGVNGPAGAPGRLGLDGPNGADAAAQTFTCRVGDLYPTPHLWSHTVSLAAATPGWCYTPRQEARTFEEAEHVCRAWGGHVASLQTEEETAMVVRLFGHTHFWTGLTRTANSGGLNGMFRNTDATDNTYANTLWAPGEPNNSGGGEYCTEMVWYEKLNDLRCSSVLPFICKKRSDAP